MDPFNYIITDFHVFMFSGIADHLVTKDNNLMAWQWHLCDEKYSVKILFQNKRCVDCY